MAMIDDFINTLDDCRTLYEKLRKDFDEGTYVEFDRLLNRGKELGRRIDRSESYFSQRVKYETYSKALLEMYAEKETFLKTKSKKTKKLDPGVQTIDLMLTKAKVGPRKLFSIVPRKGEIGNVLTDLKIYNPRKVLVSSSHDQLGGKIENYHLIISASDHEALSLAFTRGVAEIISTDVKYVQLLDENGNTKKVEEINSKGKKKIYALPHTN